MCRTVTSERALQPGAGAGGGGRSGVRAFLLSGCLLAAAAGCAILPRPRYPVRETTTAASPDVDPVARGRAVAAVLCARCHADPATGVLSGRRMTEIPAFLARVTYSSNLTGHPECGVGGWTDGELVHFLRTGVKRDGRLGLPWAPRFPLLADPDVAALVAYLRSNDPAVRPTDGTTPPTELTGLGEVVVRVVGKPLDPPTGPIAAPNPADRVAYGRYVVQAKAQCYHCHSASFSRLDELHPERSKGYLAGGSKLTGPDGKQVHAPSLIPDAVASLGSWTEDDFVRAVRYGVRPDGRRVRAPMLAYAGLTDQEVRSVYAYLRTVPIMLNPP